MKEFRREKDRERHKQKVVRRRRMRRRSKRAREGEEIREQMRGGLGLRQRRQVLTQLMTVITQNRRRTSNHL